MKNSNDRGSVSGCIVRRVGTASFLVISLLALTLWCSLGALGQEVRPQSTSSTELGRENLARVAASVGEIKLLLLKDSGLLVEVKRWMAKEATSNGQVISDLDLTDDAIFDRLVTDIPFRSAVTLILQKYGHLLPKLDPESEAAKERDLTLQERARMLAQAHQSEMASLQQSAVPGKWYSNSCDPQKTDKCQAPSDTNTEYPGIHEYVSPPSTTPELPMRPGSPNRTPGSTSTVQASYADDKAEFLPTSGTEDFQSAVRRAGGAGNSEDQQGPSTALLPGASMSEGDGAEFLASNYVGANGDRRPPGAQGQDAESNLIANREPNPSTVSGNATSQPLGPIQNRRRPQAGSEVPELVRTANPYKEVPSLYDMYVQAVARPAVPQRFGLQVFENGTRDSHLIPMDLSVGPDYVVGPGDALSIDLWGGITQRLYRVVDHSGQISLPDVGPMLVSGKSLADVQKSVEKQLSTLFRDLSADVSLSRMRTIRVYEVGEVAKPGAYDVSSLSTPLNALFVAGGPTRKGRCAW